MADDQIAEIPATTAQPPDITPVLAPQMVACQCRSTYHWRQDHGACPNPARWCQWCKDGGCVLARQADARREGRRSSSSSSRHGERRGRRRHRHGGSLMHELPAPPTVPFPMLPPLLPMPMPMLGLPCPIPWPGASDASSSSSSSSSFSSDSSFDDGGRGTQRMLHQLPRHPWM